ncbi:protein kinase domain-containing protein [Roseibacillus persicicus]|uniref:protein kinase domain-containing protein n=1 Tax=Roseibacillus persicicus TaxID=454148 RepID=UPI00280FD222|nr:protein kinase [Roseibacillus persicicus]MDQ8189458.1 protein kinase [Roseibacillus persicicus]
MSEHASPFELLPAEEIARLLPSYSEISFLAQGGMAAVYRGVQTTLDRPVAIKILPQEFGSDESFRLRFVAEGKAMARLNHPNLVSIFDFGEVEGLLYLVMEFVEGETLYQHAYGSAMEENKAVELCLQVADGLAHAHQNGILHRDIKPANVLLNQDGTPKLGDFGLAEEGERAVGDNLVFGTPGYTAPEVMANPEVADEKADIFAIGVLLYELLTTQLPSDPYQPPSRLVQADPRIDPVIAKAIQPHPEMRYATAAELADALRNLRDSMKAAPQRRLLNSGTHSGAATLKVQPTQAKSLITQPASSEPKSAAVLTTGEAHGGTSSPPPQASKGVRRSGGTDFALIRNLIIIGGLLLAIWGTWTALQQKTAEQEKAQAEENKLKERAERKRAAAAARAQAERDAAGLTSTTPQITLGSAPSPTREAPEPEEPSPLSPREQLEELRPALLAGEREKFPAGSLKRGGSHFFFVDEALTWHEAIEFAEQHGGHLAITPSKDDVLWLSSEIPDEKEVWLGAGTISRNDWAWLVRDVEFELPQPRTSTGTAAMVTSLGIIKARKPELELPFFIQWEDDGSQTGQRDSHLAKIAETMDSEAPLWPPGTLTLDEKRYLILAKPLSQTEAQDLARESGGVLAVASDELEASFLRDIATESGLPALWLGGRNFDGQWRWLTNESWDFARWAEDSPAEDPDLSGLTITASGWVNQDPDRDASGFIIEWSDDAKDAPPMEEGSMGRDTGEVGELKAMAVRLLEKDNITLIKRLKDNTAAQGMAMRQWLRSIPRENAGRFERNYALYENSISPEAIYLPGPDEVEVSFPEKGAEILTRHYQNQVRYEGEREAAAEKLRAAFIRKIEAKMTAAKSKGLVTEIAALKKVITEAGTTGKDFIAYLGLEKKEEAATN